MMTEVCGCRSHPLKVGLRFLEPCIRYVSLFEQVLSILVTTVAVFIGCVRFFPREDFLHTGSFFENLSGSKVSDVQVVRFIPVSSWFRPKFPSGLLNVNNFHQVQRMIRGIGNVLFWTCSQTLNRHDPVGTSCASDNSTW